MKKAIEVLETEAVDLRVPKISLLVGDDILLKSLVVQKFSTISGLTQEETEKHQVSSADQMVSKVGEPSLFGRRLLDIELTGKWGQTKRLSKTLKDIRDSDDVVIVRAESAPTSKDMANLFTEIECKKPTHSRTRQKLVQLRFRYYGLDPTEEAVKRLADRTECTADIEASIKTLYFAKGNHNKTVGLGDIERATAEPPERRDITRALLKGNTPRLAKELKEGVPIYTLIVLHSSLLKLYTYLEMTQAEIGEEEIIEKLNIPKNKIKEWRAAKQKYASRVVREIMETVTQAYEMYTSGREGWQEVLQFKLKSLE